MNRILFEAKEISGDIAVFGGERAEHVIKVLHGEVGQILKTGVVNGKIGTSEVLKIEGGQITVRVSHQEEALSPWVDLILAPPRPRVMKRLLPQLAAMGVGRIVLVGAKKVEKDFWGATLLKEENYRPLLIDGLMQAGTTALPIIECRRNFRKFLDEELDATFPNTCRIIAHPYLTSTSTSTSTRILLAIGPEGGWTDDEVARFEARGFNGYSLGKRILRTDTAAIALLSRLAAETGN